MLKKIGKKYKQILSVALLAVMVFLQMTGVQAETSSYEVENGIVSCGSGDASIQIEGTAGQSMVGKQFRLHQLFEVENSVGLESLRYTINPIYKIALQTVTGQKLNKNADAVSEYEIVDYMASLNSDVTEGAIMEQNEEARHGEYRYFIEALSEELDKQNLLGTSIEVKGTKADNSVVISGLTYGYYMVEDVSQTEGEHTALSMPMLSTTNPNSIMRLKADYPSVVQKIQEDEDGSWNDIGDYDIGQSISYRYQSAIPNINGYQTYYYAWHTESREVLDLQEDSIQISIKGQVNGEEKIYTLQQNEFTLIPNSTNHTFKLEVEDIKAIVDREFPNYAENGENTYGQEVTVLYQARLNEEAIYDPGCPGFENDVRLEYSNNPYVSGADETGFTPRDTVVAFTYALCGYKVNNYGEELAGAKFRLYRDEACENEIFVMKKGSTYVAIHEDSANGQDKDLAVEMVSDEDGNIQVAGLDADTYYLKEVEAPMGYRPLDEPIRVELKVTFPEDRNNYVKYDGETEFLKLTANATVKSFVDGKEVEQNLELNTDYLAGTAFLTIVNHVGRRLPVTGTSAILILTICGISCIGVALLRGRKKHE